MLTAIDLFCGAGGLTLGFERAGFRTVAAVERNADACATYREAFPDVKLIHEDARQINFKAWRGVDLVAGGPPCQPFSIGGHRRGKNDERDLLPDFVRAVEEVQPRAFLIENVPGLASASQRDYLKSILSPLVGKYSVTEPTVLNACEYGVPQSRRRLLIIGVRDRSFHFDSIRRAPRVPAGSVLSMKPFGEPNTSKVVYAKNPDLRPNPYHGQLFNGGGRAIDLDQPAPTVLASAGGNKTHFVDTGNRVPPYHRHLMTGGKPRTGTLPDARRLTVAESALLQTFPASMKFLGSRSSQYTQVGNAVPPALAEVIGQTLIKLLKTRRPRSIRSCEAVLV